MFDRSECGVKGWPGRVLILLAGLLLGMPTMAADRAPTQEQAFDVQFTVPFNFVRPVQLLELDLFDASAGRVQELRARGVATLCRISAGAWENWRPDSREFPAPLIGRPYAGWPGKRWLDIRRLDVLGPILAKRLDECRAKGFDGVDLDHVDGYRHKTGFPLTAQDQLAFNRWLAAEAKKRGLKVALKNNLEQVPELVEQFDFAISESCFSEGSCERLLPFKEAGKPVYVIEYTNIRRKIDLACTAAAELGFQVIFKTKSLNGKLHRRCP